MSEGLPQKKITELRELRGSAATARWEDIDVLLDEIDRLTDRIDQFTRAGLPEIEAAEQEAAAVSHGHREHEVMSGQLRQIRHILSQAERQWPKLQTGLLQSTSRIPFLVDVINRISTVVFEDAGQAEERGCGTAG